MLAGNEMFEEYIWDWAGCLGGGGRQIYRISLCTISVDMGSRIISLDECVKNDQADYGILVVQQIKYI